ncbi:unnamed protein product, partial [Iphiclides podalirius]
MLFSCRTTTLNVFHLHIILCVLGYQFFMCQGILVLSKYNWSMLIRRRHRRHVHWVFQLLALILVVTGSVIMIKETQNHFDTAHSILAICALVLYLTSILNGLLMLKANKLSTFVDMICVRYTHYVTSISTLFCATAITHFLLGAAAFSAFFFINIFEISNSLKQHIYLCVTGYIILMSQAVLSLNPFTSWSRCFKYEDKKIIHWTMQVTGSMLAIAGSIIRMVEVPSNFQTAHGILGVVAMVCTIFSLISGIINLFAMTLNTNINLVKISHSVLGSLGLCTAYICLCFGFNDLYRVFFGNTNANLSISLTVLALIGTLASASINTFRRILS